MTQPIRLPPGQDPSPEMVIWTGGSAKLAALFSNRGILTRGELDSILQPLARPEPQLGDYQPLVEAKTYINSALAKGEKIAVYGDYDVDGITATTVLVTALERLGADVIWHIPNRFDEGYGMDLKRVKTLAAAGVKLIITCDCGISNYEEIQLANQLGVAVVVTDHHLPPEKLPPAKAIVNFKLLPPGHPSRDLPGVGTAFILARLLLAEKSLEAEDLLDLVALGVIADVVPVLGHSRQLYLRGLPLLQKAQRLGLAALFSVAKLAPELIDEEKLGFQVAPRLNAAGRLDSGGLGVELLLAKDPEKAKKLAQELNLHNLRRKELSNEILEDLAGREGPVVAYNPGWHQGVVGIAAGQIAGRLNCPAVLMTADAGGHVVGSARSPAGIDIYRALATCEKYLLKFGGHAAAAGFSLAETELEEFTAALERTLTEATANWTPPALAVDIVAVPKDIDLGLVEELAALAPCGEGNPPPHLYSAELTVKSVRPAGPGHILTLGDRVHSFSAGLWGGGNPPEPGSGIDAVYTIARDQFRGQQAVMATVKAWWPKSRAPIAAETKLSLEDRRQAPLPEILEQYPRGLYFREGVEWLEHLGSTRADIKPCPVLVLLTAPPSPQVLRQVIATAAANKVVLAYSAPKGDFLKELLGVLKYVFGQGGIVSLTMLAAVLAQTEEVVLAALRLLADSKILSYELHAGKLVILQGAGRTLKKGARWQKLEYALMESIAFKKWLNHATLAEIKMLKL